MKKKKEEIKSVGKLSWIARILVILFILFISLFALDVFGEYQFPEVLVALFMHLIPNFILIGLLIVAWKWEKLGGILFLVLWVVFVLFFRLYRDVISFLLIGLPVLIIAILFLLSNYMKKKD